MDIWLAVAIGISIFVGGFGTYLYVTQRLSTRVSTRQVKPSTKKPKAKAPAPVKAQIYGAAIGACVGAFLQLVATTNTYLIPCLASAGFFIGKVASPDPLKSKHTEEHDLQEFMNLVMDYLSIGNSLPKALLSTAKNMPESLTPVFGTLLVGSVTPTPEHVVPALKKSHKLATSVFTKQVIAVLTHLVQAGQTGALATLNTFNGHLKDITVTRSDYNATRKNALSGLRAVAYLGPAMLLFILLVDVPQEGVTALNAAIAFAVFTLMGVISASSHDRINRDY
jgi:hypothetical protein